MARRQNQEARWYFTITSEIYGKEEFGPYDTEEEAQKGLLRVKEKEAGLDDGMDREYLGPWFGTSSGFPWDVSNFLDAFYEKTNTSD